MDINLYSGVIKKIRVYTMSMSSSYITVYICLDMILVDLDVLWWHHTTAEVVHHKDRAFFFDADNLF
jgi:hypothetical protein